MMNIDTTNIESLAEDKSTGLCITNTILHSKEIVHHVSDNMASTSKPKSTLSLHVGFTPIHINASLINPYSNIVAIKKNENYNTNWDAFTKHVTNLFSYH